MSYSVNCSVTLLPGSPDGDQIFMAYHRVSTDVINRINNAHPVPLRTLVGYQRVHASSSSSPAASVNIVLDIEAAFSLTDVNINNA